MSERTLIGRLLSPAGFGLVLLLFLLPFLSVSCSTDGGDVVATFSGVDMLIGGEPDLVAPTSDAEAQEAQRTIVAVFHDSLDAEPLAILAALAVLFAMATTLIGERLARHAIGAGLAVVAAALLGGAYVRATGHVGDAIRAISEPPDTLAYSVAPRYGFWVCVGLLLALAAGHLAAMVRAWKGPADAPRPDELDEADLEVDLRAGDA